MKVLNKYLLALAGEYRVCSELCKRGVLATVTYGNRKSVDIYAIGDQHRRVLRIEVKTSRDRRKFVTNLSKKKPNGGEFDVPDFWVLIQIQQDHEGAFRERFFVLSHGELEIVQTRVNDAYDSNYLARHGRNFERSRGVDSVTVADVEKHEGRWEKISTSLTGNA